MEERFILLAARNFIGHLVLVLKNCFVNPSLMHSPGIHLEDSLLKLTCYMPFFKSQVF